MLLDYYSQYGFPTKQPVSDIKELVNAVLEKIKKVNS